jgi:hypothetical protein
LDDEVAKAKKTDHFRATVARATRMVDPGGTLAQCVDAQRRMQAIGR